MSWRGSRRSWMVCGCVWWSVGTHPVVSLRFCIRGPVCRVVPSGNRTVSWARPARWRAGEGRVQARFQRLFRSSKPKGFFPPTHRNSFHSRCLHAFLHRWVAGVPPGTCALSPACKTGPLPSPTTVHVSWWVGEFFSFWAVWLMGVWNASSVCPWPGAYPRLSGIPEMV